MFLCNLATKPDGFGGGYSKGDFATARLCASSQLRDELTRHREGESLVDRTASPVHGGGVTGLPAIVARPAPNQGR